MFGGWFSKSDEAESDSLISNEDKLKMQKFIEENFSEEVLNMPIITRPKDYAHMKFGIHFSFSILQ